jgi:uncharacterized protein
MGWWSDRKSTSAVKNNNATDVEKLILKGADPNWTDNGKSLLMWSVEQGHSDIASFLLGRGADVNDEDPSGRTVLITAADKGHTDIARSLLDKAADLKVKDSDGWTALMWATSKDHTEIAQCLREKGAEE